MARQFLPCRYKGRGLFLKGPYVGISLGQWRLLADDRQDLDGPWDRLEDLLAPERQDSEAAELYSVEINAAIDTYVSRNVRQYITRSATAWM